MYHNTRYYKKGMRQGTYRCLWFSLPKNTHTRVQQRRVFESVPSECRGPTPGALVKPKSKAGNP